jgi:hypothetical protein
MSEFAVWSALMDSGFTVDREPAVLSGTSVRRPDFGVAVGGEYYLIEVSGLYESAWEKAARVVDDRVLISSEAFFDDRLVRISPSKHFLAETAPRLAAYLATESASAYRALDSYIDDNVLPPVRSAFAEARARGGAPGEYSASGVGTVTLSVSPGQEATSELMPAPPAEDVARRVVRKALEEARQLQPGRTRLRRGIVVLDLGRAHSIIPVARAAAELISSGARLQHLERLTLMLYFSAAHGPSLTGRRQPRSTP